MHAIFSNAIASAAVPLAAYDLFYITEAPACMHK